MSTWSRELNLINFNYGIFSSIYQPHIHRGKLEELLECIAVLSANIADDEGTQASRRINIVNGVNNLRQALQDLLKEYERNKGK
jgi:hypothetical protein